ncbi:MAG TPA: AI-2E family transporter [Terriglobia bacterium]|nr:AI-2E family transporter [Terriglobia bacterium]
MVETNRETRSVATASISLGIIAAAIVIAALYYASSILITLICSVFIAFVLEPPVRLMERLRIPRWVGSLLVVVLTLAVMYVLIYLAYDHVVDFLNTIPRVVGTVQRMVARLEVWARSLGPGASTLLPSTPDTSVPTVRLQEESPWTQFLLRGIGSVYAFTVTVAFIPFLVFFMLASKNHIWAATLNLFPMHRRQQTEDVIGGITAMVRQYVLGNILVALIAAVMILPVFIAVSLPYPLLLALFAAFLSVIPYIGVALGMLPPLLMAVAHDDSVGHLVAIVVVVFLVHFVAVNVLTPKLVGRRVKLNALSVTLSMMFWGWLWGGLGLVLAVPITAGLKAICDNIQSLKPFGAWMGEG